MADRSYPARDFHHKRSRSRSPMRHSHSHSHSHSHRERSPHHHHYNKRRRSTEETAGVAKELPHNARQLRKEDFERYRPLLALYLDVHKGKLVQSMEEREVKGRWKSFLGKWNRGELSEGWYDPQKMTTAVVAQGKIKLQHDVEELEEDMAGTGMKSQVAEAGGEANPSDSDDDDIGPSLPGQERSRAGRMGPSIPGMQDLELKREMEAEDAATRMDDIRYARKLDRKEQKTALDELVPRAEAGTRERQLEKKKEVNEKMKSFREKSPGAAEVPDTELMGGGDGIESYKKQKQEFERKKNERELRKEEILRARMAEREERLQEYRSKEEGTMTMLKALAKQRFG